MRGHWHYAAGYGFSGGIMAWLAVDSYGWIMGTIWLLGLVLGMTLIYGAGGEERWR